MSALIAFAELAGRYCAFVESLRDGRVSNLYSSLERFHAEIYAAILLVDKEVPLDKKVSRRTQRTFDNIRMSHDEWRDLACAIAKTTGKETAELIAWHESLRGEDKSGDDYEVIRASMLWDDLADIYRDLRHGLQLWKLDTPAAQAQAAWEWRFQYEIHWGEHLFRAMESVHEARYELFAD